MKAVPRSTEWYRKNKEKVHSQQSLVKRTLKGKLTNLITTSKYRSKISGRDHTISTKDLITIYENQNGKCAITGIEMGIRGEGNAANSPFSISLDRIDSNKGYTKDNVWLVCTSVNIMKSKLSMEDFVLICKKVVENF